MNFSQTPSSNPFALNHSTTSSIVQSLGCPLPIPLDPPVLGPPLPGLEGDNARPDLCTGEVVRPIAEDAAGEGRRFAAAARVVAGGSPVALAVLLTGMGVAIGSISPTENVFEKAVEGCVDVGLLSSVTVPVPVVVPVVNPGEIGLGSVPDRYGEEVRSDAGAATGKEA